MSGWPEQETPRIPAPAGGQRYRMTVAYDGGGYFGWQNQPGRKTVQGALEKALETLTQEEVRVHACGRTDAGVHARGQTAHFDLRRPWGGGAGGLEKGLNALLDGAVRVRDVREARATFHARYDAKGKQYRYWIWNGKVENPLLRGHAEFVRTRLDLEAMREAARRLEGRHDFAAFSANPHREIGGTVRTLWRLGVKRRGELVTIEAEGDGFLYKMVRSLAGHLIRVGRGAVPAEETTAILESRTRTARVETAAARGLCLWEVYYRRKKGWDGAGGANGATAGGEGRRRKDKR